MFDSIADTTLVALIGLAGGVILGLAARLGRFCTLGAVEDMLYQGSSVRMRMWGLAIGVAVIGSFTLIGTGLLQPEQTIYLGFAFNPFAAVLGGLVFGYGMALAGNCGFGTLARLGGGDLRSFVIVLVMGISAYVTLSGPLAALRVAVFPRPAGRGRPAGAGASDRVGFRAATGRHRPCDRGRNRRDARFGHPKCGRGQRRSSGARWWALPSALAGRARNGSRRTGLLPCRSKSHTFSAPMGDTILYLMTSSGTSLNFGVGSVVGVLLGAFIGSLINGHFRWEACEDPRELRRQIMGGALMGVGAVVAFGCTIGQGISAFSVLAFSAPVTMLSIIAGCAFGLRQLIEGFAPAE